jgi:hypothetical protein
MGVMEDWQLYEQPQICTFLFLREENFVYHRKPLPCPIFIELRKGDISLEHKMTTTMALFEETEVV